MRIFRAMARSSSSRSCRSCSCWIIFSWAAFLSALNWRFSAFCILSFSFSCGVSLGLAAPVSLPAAGSVFFSFSPTAGDAAGLVSFSLGGDGEWLWLWLLLWLLLLLWLGLRLPLWVRLRLRDGLRDQLLRLWLRLLLWCLGPRAPRL